MTVIGDSLPKGEVPLGSYAGGSRSPVVHVRLCAPCAGFPPMSAPGYEGALSGQCFGCGAYSRELHRFPAVLITDGGCSCPYGHEPVAGDLPASAGRHAWQLTPPAENPVEMPAWALGVSLDSMAGTDGQEAAG